MSFKPKSFLEARENFKPLRRSQMNRKKGIKSRFNRKPSVDGDSERNIRDDCDELVRQILKLRDSKCVIFDCIATEGLQVGHYIKREILSLRWDLRNCNAQCPFHNKAHNENPKSYRDSMFLKYGIGVTFQIELTAKENPRLEYVDLLAARDGLRSELARLKETT